MDDEIKLKVQEIFKKYSIVPHVYSDAQGKKKHTVKVPASTSLLQVLAEIGTLCEVTGGTQG
jgi:hypothetical protein